MSNIENSVAFSYTAVDEYMKFLSFISVREEIEKSFSTINFYLKEGKVLKSPEVIKAWRDATNALLEILPYDGASPFNKDSAKLSMNDLHSYANFDNFYQYKVLESENFLSIGELSNIFKVPESYLEGFNAQLCIIKPFYGDDDDEDYIPNKDEVVSYSLFAIGGLVAIQANYFEGDSGYTITKIDSLKRVIYGLLLSDDE